MGVNPNPQTWKLKINGESMDLTLDAVRRLNSVTNKILRTKAIGIDKYIGMVCHHQRISREELLSKCKQQHLVVGRWCLWRLLWLRHHNVSEVARQTGADRTNVAYGLRKLKTLLTTDASYRKELAWLENEA